MSLHNLTKWSSVRGFNYQPGYSSHLQYTWTHFNPAYWEREVPWSLRFGTNVLRVWLDWSAFLAAGNEVLDNFDTALAILDRNGISMMPVLFNRWTDARYPAGGISDSDLRAHGQCFEKFFPYIDALAERFGDDRRITAWDLCNEPQAPGPSGDVAALELAWLSTVAGRLRGKSEIPITIGTMTGFNVAMYAPLVDVISFHPYPSEVGEMEPLCVSHLKLAKQLGKPLLCTETCKGSFDDDERGSLAEDGLDTLERHDIGWLAWQLVEGPFVTGNRQHTDDNAVRPGEGYMPFVLADGRTRPGHEGLVRRGSEVTGASTISVIRPSERKRDE